MLRSAEATAGPAEVVPGLSGWAWLTLIPAAIGLLGIAVPGLEPLFRSPDERLLDQVLERSLVLVPEDDDEAARFRDAHALGLAYALLSRRGAPLLPRDLTAAQARARAEAAGARFDERSRLAFDQAFILGTHGRATPEMMALARERIPAPDVLGRAVDLALDAAGDDAAAAFAAAEDAIAFKGSLRALGEIPGETASAIDREIGRALSRVLTIDPRHAAARGARGDVRYDADLVPLLSRSDLGGDERSEVEALHRLLSRKAAGDHGYIGAADAEALDLLLDRFEPR